MKKTDKKRENAIISSLNQVCDRAQSQYVGFKWLTHFVNYDRFPDSLSIVCVFDTNNYLAEANKDALRALIKEKLAVIDIKLNDLGRHVSFDTEENCTIENDGKWNERFK